MAGLKKLAIISALFLLLLLKASEGKEIKTITLFGGFVDNTNKFDKAFQFPAPPDGITEVYYAKAKVRTDMAGTSTRIYFYVNGKSCVPEYYDVSEKSYGYTMEFDCTSIIAKEGNYSFTIDSQKNLRNTYIEWEITYLNNPKSPKLSLFGTDYYPNEKGKVFLQFLNINNEPVNNGYCEISIYYPNNTKMVGEEGMVFLENGIYYYDIQPKEEGIHMVAARCLSPAQKKTYYAQDFANYTNMNISGDYTFTWSLDRYAHNITPVGILANFSYTFYPAYENGSTAQIHWYGGGYGNMIIGFYNCSSKKFQDVSPTLVLYPNSLYHHYVTLKSDFFCSNQTLINFRLIGLNVWTDYLYFDLYNTSYYEQEIRGGGEIHVSNLAKFLDLSEETLLYNHDYCVDNSTLRKEVLVQKCVDAVCWNTTKIVDTVCAYGCENSECKEAEWKVWLYVFAAIVACAFIVLVLIRYGGGI